MTSPFYTPTGNPASGGQGSSSDIRAEFLAIETAMDKLPALTADYVIKVNAAGTALEPVQYLDTAQGGTGVGTLTENGILYGKAASPVAATAELADGQLVIGRTGSTPIPATLTAGTYTTIVEAAGSITIDVAPDLTLTSLTVPGDAILTAPSNTSVRLGFDAGSVMTGASNVAIGYKTLESSVASQAITAVGNRALNLNTASNATGIGHNALTNNTTGVRVTALGTSAAQNTSVGADVCAIGYRSLFDSLASNVTAVGSLCLQNVTTGDNNTGLGHDAGSTITTGDSNTMIGVDSDASSTSASNQIVIGVGITATADDQVSIGKLSNIVSNDFGTDAVWTRASDIERKTEIEDSELGLAFINDLRPVTYKWKAAKELPKAWGIDPKAKINTDIVMTSLIAQEVEEALIKANIGVRFPGWKQTNQGQTIAAEAYIFPLINAIKELTDRLEALESK